MGGWRKWQLGRNSRGCQVTKSWECLKVFGADGLEKMIITQSFLAGGARSVEIRGDREALGPFAAQEQVVD